MTAHPNDGLIQAFLDEELDREGRQDVAAHLEECGACGVRAHELRASSDQAVKALDRLDIQPPTEWALAAMRRRIGGATRSSGLRFPGLARAAGIALVLVGGAASALPGSPVRDWIARGWDRLTEAPTLEEAGSQPTETAPARAPSESEAGAGIGLVAGAVELRVEGLPEGGEIRVVLVEGDHAGIYGPPGTRFRTEEGRVEAFTDAGGIRVELPRAAARATVTVNGELYLRKVGASLEILGPVQDSAAAEIRFRR